MLSYQTRNLLEQLWLFVLCGFLLAWQGFSEVTVLFCLLSLIGIGLMYMAELLLLKRVIFVGGVLAAMQWPELLFFLPAAVSVLFAEKLSNTEVAGYVFLLGSVFWLQEINYLLVSLLLLLSLGAVYIGGSRRRQQVQFEEYQSLKDDSWQQRHQLEAQNAQLIAKQADSVELELIKERNRIAHDIHDNVGHLLSRALLQLGAIQAVNQQSGLTKLLDQLQETIDQGMNNIRHSVHNTFHETLDFQHSLAFIVENFNFCSVEVKGQAAEIPLEFGQTLTMIIKEALSNVMKHSDATKVTITFVELPAFYKCVIHDNGTLNEGTTVKGIGLIGMQERLKKVNGQLHIVAKDGFMLTIILPKEAMTVLES